MNGFYNDPIGHWIIVTVAILALLGVVLTATAYTVWFERVALGRIQRRPGPNRCRTVRDNAAPAKTR